MTFPVGVDELLDQADALRLGGRGADARPLYEQAIDRSRSEGDMARWTRAALGAASVYVYGTDLAGCRPSCMTCGPGQSMMPTGPGWVLPWPGAGLRGNSPRARVFADGAYMWLAAGRPDKAHELLHSMHGPVLDELPRDVNWLLSLQCALEAALGVGDRFIIDKASRLLDPYTGRAVINAGAVMFHGLTDDTLARAAATLGDDATAAIRRESALATYTRLGASWWRDRLSRWRPLSPPAPTTLRLSPTGDGFWLVGTESQSVPVKALKGYSYLRELLRRPGLPVAAIDLVTGGAGTVEQPGLGSLLDPSALKSYRQRLKDLDADIAEAGDWSDPARREALEAERNALVDERMTATGLGGRKRTVGSNREPRPRCRHQSPHRSHRPDHRSRRTHRPPPAAQHPHRLSVHLPARRRTPSRLDPRLISLPAQRVGGSPVSTKSMLMTASRRPAGNRVARSSRTLTLMVRVPGGVEGASEGVAVLTRLW